MESIRIFDTIDTHTAGEPTRIITSTIDWDAKSRDVRERRDQFKAEYDWIRELLLCEPRGHADMFGAIPVPTRSEESDLGLFFMDGKGYLDMCGHGTIGVVSAFIKTGQLEPKEVITIETPAGTVEARPNVEDGEVQSVKVRNVESYVYGSTEIHIDDIGSVEIDLVYSGNLFALVDVEQFVLEVAKENVNDLIDLGMQIREAANDQLTITNPRTGEPDEVKLTEIYQRSGEVDRNITIFGEGQVDRSPCGTGTCAKMTLMHSKDQLEPNESYRYDSVIGTRFSGRIRDVEEEDSYTILSPEIKGSAYIISKNTYLLDPEDPLDGFLL